MTLSLQPLRIQTGTADEEGCLVFLNDRLVAVLVRLSHQHDDLAGQWYYEHGFGPYNGPAHPVFETIEAAQDWIDQRGHDLRRRRQTPPTGER